ncbi:MAG: tetratricopeptide repeat protein [Candidatus Anaerobiospirillum merdipullorum]|uniref:Tetratricopeptide repeat protein n=1 Tax=Candidatus Anaerobiospirillum merdipullorum TaxID=2838450 RepID=A0A9E2NRA3_9GAMM|nr:tetratricopeptide repeat protein [Candidatus Anaerobiospirillum merdipullorum]
MQLTEQNVREAIIDGSMNKAVFLYFYLDAPECAAITQTLQTAISDDNAYLSLVLANVQEPVAQAVAMQLGLQNVPTLVVFKEGKPTDFLQGDEIKERLTELMHKYMPSESELQLRDALMAEAAGNMAEALSKASIAYNSDTNNLQAKHIYARLLIANKNLERAAAILADAGREERESKDYQDLMSALDLAQKAQDSPALHQLADEYAKNPTVEVALKYAAALVEAGKKAEALDLLFGILQHDLSQAEVKKTFLDILNTMAGDPLQGKYRRRLYTLLY